ncbi:hypothetical protein FO519_000424 [Halicephalobus sp. NKZ332]|nr:hypothetical protein FO519_000424 [Halicephalobus sp. NKZ332]
MDSDWISCSPHFYKLILGDRVFAPRLKRRPWTTYSLEEVFNNRGDTLESLMEVKGCIEELMKKSRLFHFSLEISLTNFIKKRGTEDLKEAFNNVDQDPLKLSKEAAFTLLAEIYDNMLLDQDLLEYHDVPAEQLRFEPFFVDKFRNQYYYFGWQYIFRIDAQKAGTSSDVSRAENGEDESSFPPVLAVASSAEEFQRIFESVARRGEHMSAEITEILKVITIYKRSLPVVRFKSARLIRKQEAIKSERVLAAKAAIEAMKNDKDKPKLEEHHEPTATAEDLRRAQQQKRAERYARRNQTRDSVSPATMELIKTTESEERSNSSASVSTKNSEKQDLGSGKNADAPEDEDLDPPEEFDEEMDNPLTEEHHKKIDETIQEVLDRVAGKRKLGLAAGPTSVDESEPGSNGASRYVPNGNPPPKKFIPIKLVSRPSNGHANPNYSPTVVPLHTIQRNGVSTVASPKVIYRNIFDPNDPRNSQPRVFLREAYPERTVVHRIQNPSGVQRRIVHLSPRVVVPVRSSSSRFPAPIIRRIVYTTGAGPGHHPLPQSSMHNGTFVESQNSEGPVV